MILYLHVKHILWVWDVKQHLPEGFPSEVTHSLSQTHTLKGPINRIHDSNFTIQ